MKGLNSARSHIQTFSLAVHEQELLPVFVFRVIFWNLTDIIHSRTRVAGFFFQVRCHQFILQPHGADDVT